MIDKTSAAQGHEENLSRLKQRIEILERSLQREQAEKKRFELELHTIKSSLAWLAIIKYRGLRDRLFPTGTRRGNLYGIIKAVLKDRVWNKDARSDLSLGHLPGLLRQGLNVSGTGCIDHPLANETLHCQSSWITGWVVLSTPLARVDITVDGTVHACARLGIYRPELKNLFPRRPEAIFNGFEYLFDLTSLPAERSSVVLGAVAHGLDGSCFPISTISVSVASQEAPYEYHNGRASRIRKGAKRVVSGNRGTSEESIRLLAFAHHLGYGGGQLYLYELLRRLSRQDNFTAAVVAPVDGPLRSAIEDMGIPVYVTDGYPYQSGEMFEAKVCEVVSWAQPKGFNVALVNTAIALPGPEVAIRLGIPFVWAIHESWKPHMLWSVAYPPPGAHPHIRQLITEAFNEAAAVVFVADATRLQYQPYGEKERFVVVPLGIDMDHVDHYRASFDRAVARRRLGIPATATAILCMSSFIEPRKAQVLLVQGFRELASVHPDAFLILVGDTASPYGEALRSYVIGAGLQQRVLISPVVPDPYEWYGSADLLVCPSDVESLPRCVIEAMAFELPVLATEIFGLPELIKDGDTGYLCSPCDLVALTAGLERVLSENKEKRRQVAKNGANLVRTRHDSRGYANAYLRLLQGLIRNPAANPEELLADSKL